MAARDRMLNHISWRVLSVAAGTVVALAAVGHWHAGFAVFALIGTVLAYTGVALGAGRPDDNDKDERAVALVAGFGVGAFLIAALPFANAWYGSDWPLLGRAVVGACGLLPVVWSRMRADRSVLILRMATASLIIVMGVSTVARSGDQYTDIRYGNIAAAEALASGSNPYETSFPDTAPEPWNQGSIPGYSYPPVSLLLYGLAETVVDARLVSIGLIAVTYWILSRPRSRLGYLSLVPASLTVLIPLTSVAVLFSWTEPLQALLLIAAAVTFPRAVGSSALVGLAIASKQYVALVTVPLMTMPLSERARRLGVVAATAIVAMVPFFVWSPPAMWTALVGHQFDRPIRGDTLSVTAYGVAVPIAVAIAVAVLAGLALGRRSRTGPLLLLVQAVVLATFFALSVNTFANYWYIVSVLMIAAGTIGHPSERTAASRGQEDAQKVSPVDVGER